MYILKKHLNSCFCERAINKEIHYKFAILENLQFGRVQWMFLWLLRDQTTVESNYVIAIATLSDWLKRLAPVFQPM